MNDSPAAGTAVRKSLDLLTPRDRRRYRVAVGLQMATSLLDLAGVLLLGLVGVLAASAASDSFVTPAQGALQRMLTAAGGQPLDLALILSGVAAVLLISKGLVVMYINRRVGLFLARCAHQVSARLSSEFFSMPLYRVQHFPSQFSAYALGQGVNGAVIDILSNAMVFRTEAALLVVLGAALLVIEPITTAVVVSYMLVVVWLLARTVRQWAAVTGATIAETDIASIKAIQDGIATYREVSVAGNRRFLADRYQSLRQRGARATADQRFIGTVPRYLLEIAMVVGAALLVTVLALTQDTGQAIGSLALFLAAASRVMPSLLRLNSSRLTIRTIAGRAAKTFELADYCQQYATELPAAATQPAPIRHDLDLAVTDLVVRYPESARAAVDGVTLRAGAGGHVALVGPSGAGKSTLADALLGVIEPESGQVLIGGTNVRELIAKRPGSIAYVPQDVALVSGTVRMNVALAREDRLVDDELVWHCLEKAHLADFLREHRDGLDTLVGDRGVRLSGGQRQRLGIARAIYCRPGLIVLDEATSALDAETEHSVTEMLTEVGAGVTRVTVAHRLATIRNADLVVYLEDGKVLASGTFDEVRSNIPSFDRQASLLGM